MCPTGLQLNKVNSSDAEALFLDFGLSVAGDIVSSGVCDRLDGFGFEIVNLPFLDGDVSRSPSCGVCVSRLVRFARVCSGVGDFGSGGLFLVFCYLLGYWSRVVCVVGFVRSIF